VAYLAGRLSMKEQGGLHIGAPVGCCYQVIWQGMAGAGIIGDSSD
jgi:hypothetical protein